MNKIEYKWLWFIIPILLVIYLQSWGIDSLVMGSDELHPARTLISDDWSLVNYPWPEEAVREYYNNWPIQFPPLFGLAIRASVVLLGVNHLALRLVPLIFALLAVLATFGFYKHYMNRFYAACCALLLGMTSDKLMIYAKSLKHYTLDIFFAALLLMLGNLTAKDNSVKNWVLLTVASAVSVWFAFASIYVVAAIYLYLFARYVWKKQYRGERFWSKIILSGAGFTLSFIGLYLVSIRNAVSNPVFIQEWLVQIFHWDKVTDIGYVAHYIAHTGKHVLILPGYFYFDALWMAVVGNFLIVVWMVDRFRNRAWDQVLLLVAPLLLVLAASLAGKYPFSAGRLTLFLLPSWTLMMLLGGRIVYQYLNARRVWLARTAAGVAIVIVLFAVYSNIRKVYHGKYAGGRHVDKLMYTLKDQARNGDTAYLHWGAILPFYFYYTDHQPGYQSGYPTYSDEGKLHIIWGEEHTLHPELNGPLFDRIAAVPGRLWIVFGHLWPAKDMKELQSRLDNSRELLATYTFKGCKLFLYDRLQEQPTSGAGQEVEGNGP